MSKFCILKRALFYHNSYFRWITLPLNQVIFAMNGNRVRGSLVKSNKHARLLINKKRCIWLEYYNLLKQFPTGLNQIMMSFGVTMHRNTFSLLALMHFICEISSTGKFTSFGLSITQYILLHVFVYLFFLKNHLLEIKEVLSEFTRLLCYFIIIVFNLTATT